MNKSILVFATTYPTFIAWDATPPFVHELSKRLVGGDFNIVVLCPRRPWAKKYEEKDWVKIHRFSYFFFDNWEKLTDWAIVPNIKSNFLLILQVPFLLIWATIWLFKLGKIYLLESIHAHRIFPSWTLAVLYKKLFNKNVNIIVTSHGSDLHTLKWFLIDVVKKRTIHNSNKVTVVSLYLKNLLNKLMWADVKPLIIPMWVDDELFNPDKKDDSLRRKHNIVWPFLLNVWRLAPEKWQKDLIYAMPEILKSKPNTKLVIIWGGPLMSELKKLSIDLWVSENILLLWKVNNSQLPVWYATCDIFIMSSYKEWNPVVLIEAIVSWAWIVSSDIQQCVDVMEKLWVNCENIYETWKPNQLAKKVIEFNHCNNSATNINSIKRKTVAQKFKNVLTIK